MTNSINSIVVISQKMGLETSVEQRGEFDVGIPIDPAGTRMRTSLEAISKTVVGIAEEHFGDLLEDLTRNGRVDGAKHYNMTPEGWKQVSKYHEITNLRNKQNGNGNGT